MPKLTFAEFVQRSAKPRGLQREGQFWMNQLADCHPELYRAITATQYDVFYNEQNMDVFWSFILRNWDKL
jgi:hypothetical protein